MSDPAGPPLRPEILVGAFVDEDVEFLIVGGIAADLYGAERKTNDLDLCVRWTDENLDRVAAALTRLQAGLRVEGSDEPHELSIVGAFVKQFELSTWRTTGGDVDILRNLPAGGSHRWYDELAERSTPAHLAGHEVRLASLADIIESKRTTNRPTDLEALPELEALARAGAPDPDATEPSTRGPASWPDLDPDPEALTSSEAGWPILDAPQRRDPRDPGPESRPDLDIDPEV